MTTIQRLLSILSVTLPLAACAAQPASAPAAAPGTAGQQQAQASSTAPAPRQDAPAVQPATPSPATQAAQPAAQAAQDSAPVRAAQPRQATPSADARSNAPSPSTNAPAAPQDGTATPGAQPSAPAVGGSGMALPPAASPDTTVGGGAANNRTLPAPAQGPVTMPSGSATGSLLQTLFALVVVLAVLGALAWFLKRYGPKAVGGSANLRVVGTLNLGGRERLMVVEVGNQWIVVGASPGRVNALATMPKQEGEQAAGGATLAPHGTAQVSAANSFGDWLKQTLDKRK